MKQAECLVEGPLDLRSFPICVCHGLTEQLGRSEILPCDQYRGREQELCDSTSARDSKTFSVDISTRRSDGP